MGTWNTDGTINKSHYAFNINCGLSKRFFDLSLGTDVKDATVTIMVTKQHIRMTKY